MLIQAYIERKIHVLSLKYIFCGNVEYLVRNSPLHQWLFSGHHSGLRSAFKACFVFSMVLCRALKLAAYFKLLHNADI